MNLFIVTGRLTQNPEVRTSQNGNYVARFRFAVNRTFRRDGEPEADFFQCVTFGKTAENFEKLHIQKGTKLLLRGEFRNNDYTDRDGVKRYGYDALVHEFEFCESKSSSSQKNTAADLPPVADEDGFMHLPDGVDDEGLPFN